MPTAAASCRSGSRAVQVSAETGEGLDELRDAIEAASWHLRSMELLVPYDEGGSLPELHEVAGEVERADTPEGVVVRARVPAVAAARFERFAVPTACPRSERAALRGGSPPSPAAPRAPTTTTPASTCAPPRRRTLGPGERASVGTGVAVAIPAGHAGSCCRARASRRGTG